MNYPHPILAREGWPFIAAALAAAVIVWAVAGFAWSVPLWLVAVFVIQFFRDPPREVPTSRNAVLSPADGRIVKVEKVRDPMTERDTLLISVFMNVFNVHSNRAPVDGTVETHPVQRRQVRQCRPRQGLERERAQRDGDAARRRRADRASCRSPA